MFELLVLLFIIGIAYLLWLLLVAIWPYLVAALAVIIILKVWAYSRQTRKSAPKFYQRSRPVPQPKPTLPPTETNPRCNERKLAWVRHTKLALPTTETNNEAVSDKPVEGTAPPVIQGEGVTCFSCNRNIPVPANLNEWHVRCPSCRTLVLTPVGRKACQDHENRYGSPGIHPSRQTSAPAVLPDFAAGMLPEITSRQLDEQRGTSEEFFIENYRCDGLVRLPWKIKGRGIGGKVNLLEVCVDITYSVVAGDVIIKRVQLHQPDNHETDGGMELDSSVVGGFRMELKQGKPFGTNVHAVRAGESWVASSDEIPESYLVEAVQKDLSNKKSRLNKIVQGKWRNANREANTESLTEALNEQASPTDIKKLLSAIGYGAEITFTYTKANGDSDVRHVKVVGVQEKSIRARDLDDDTVKTFRIDRITDAGPA